jgi:hypothetical protein
MIIGDGKVVEELREIKLLLNRISITLDYLWRDIRDIKAEIRTRTS